MKKVKATKAKKKVVHHFKKSYDLTEGNMNEFLLILGGGAFVLFSVLYLMGIWFK